MSSLKAIPTGVAKAGEPSNGVEPFLSLESQQDLDDALDETPSPEDVKIAWVDENIRDLYRAFAKGRKGGTSAAVPDKEGVEVFSAVEGTGTGTGTGKDLRGVLVSWLLAIYPLGEFSVFGGKWVLMLDVG